MARLFCILALVAMCSIAAFAQQVVPCTYPSTDFSGGRNRYVGAGGSVSSSIPSSITSRSVSCWQLDGFASQGAALSPGETTSPASPLIQLPLSSATSTTVASSVCSTDTAIYGKVREISLTGTTDNCSVTAQVFSRTSAPDNGQGRLGIGSDNGCNYSAKYRLDGSGACPGNSISQSFALTSASGKSLSSMGDTFEITLGTDGGSIPVVSLTIDVYGQSATDKATITFPIDKNTNSISTAENYIIPFASFSGSQTAFSNTGAIEVTFGGADVDALMFFFDVIQNPTTNVGATVFVDCGCNGFQQGSGDSLQANVPVTLNVAGAGCTASSQTVNTNSQGSVSFTNLPAGCTYTLSVSGQNLCTNSPTSQSVASGGSASFAIQGAAGGLVIPTDRTVNCGTDTSPTTTGSATSGTGQCGSGTGTPQFTDVVTPQTCSAPGGTLSVIKRTWTLNGSSQTQTITVVDTRTIALQGVPTGSTLNCNDPIPTAAVTGVACTAVTVTNNQNNVVGTCDTTTCTQTGSVTVTYTGRDVCGNTATRTVTYQRNGCAPSCPPPSTPPPPPPNAPPPPTQLPTNANCRFICDDDDSSAVHLMVSAVLAVVLALVAAF